MKKLIAILVLSSLSANALAAGKGKIKSFASGQVTFMVSANQNGRAVTYRAMIVRLGAEPERNLQVVIEKVQQKVDSAGKVRNQILEQLIIPETYLPYGQASVITANPLWKSEVDQESTFVFNLGLGTCRFKYDGAGTGSSLTLDDWSCEVGE